MSAWLFVAWLAINLTTVLLVRIYVVDAKARAFATGVIMGRASAQVDQESQDRFLREAGIDPATLPDRP